MRSKSKNKISFIAELWSCSKLCDSVVKITLHDDNTQYIIIIILWSYHGADTYACILYRYRSIVVIIIANIFSNSRMMYLLWPLPTNISRVTLILCRSPKTM